MPNYRADNKQGGINPYHFVRLGSDVSRKKPECGTQTGVIRCHLKATQPLCIPDMPKSKMIMTNDTDHPNQEHRKVPFFKVGEKPVIPGSELRGMIRSAFEALSNSCLSVNNNNDLTARSSAIRQPGLLRFETTDQKWHLYKATTKKLKYDGSEDFDGTDDTIKREWLNYRYVNKKPQYNEGRIPVMYKFMLTSEQVDADNIDTAVEDYKLVCKFYIENDKGGKHKIAKFIRTPGKDNHYYPVYYLLTKHGEQTLVYLSPAQISRSMFHNKLDILLGSHSHCVKSNELCEACRLFGMIADRKKQDQELPSAVASRLRFTDAVCTKQTALNYETLRELSSPKLSSVEFYSTSTDMKTLWTYDTPGTTVNGRKFYFHHSSRYQDDVRTKRNMTAEVLEAGAEFTFDVFFDHLTENELHKLIWTLAIGDNDLNSSQQHKLGHGKPLGLGSVKIIVDSVTRRTFDPKTLEYTESKDETDYFAEVPFDLDAAYFADYMHMTDATFLNGYEVKYPYGDDGKGKKTSTGTLAWFQGNHNDGQTVKAGEPCPIAYSLPQLKAQPKELVLPALIKDGQQSRSANGNNRRDNGRNDRKQSYSGPTVFESKTAPIIQTQTVHCKTKKCKGEMQATITTGFFKTEQELTCPICGKITKVKL